MATLINRRYRLQEKLGEGGMGAVYRAYDRLTGNDIALKRVTTAAEHLSFSTRDSGDSGDLRLALAQEFKTLASLRHPNIISVLDYGFDAEQLPYVTMQILENAPTIKQAAHNLALEEKVDLVIQMLQALAYLHRRGILHRDLKPSNVLAVNGQVKVLDFGLAVAREQVREGRFVGTLAYMAPEVMQGEVPTEASDLYAVGVMAYELFSGQHPFDISDSQKLMADVLGSEPDMTPLEHVTPTPTPEQNTDVHMNDGVPDTVVPLDDDHASDILDAEKTKSVAKQHETVLGDSGHANMLDSEKTNTLHEALTNVAKASPRPPASRRADMPSNPLAWVVLKLLAKRPANRFQNVAEVITGLSAAIGKPAPEESAAIRESYLQAAKFVGREQELGQLSDVLKETIENKKGAAWLIGGESGVGKSRLVDELRTLALVEGAEVVRGQAVSEGGVPYHIWRDVLRWLALNVDLDDEEAGILKALVQDVGNLLEREVLDAPALDPQQTQVRLFKTVTGVIQRLTRPMMVILEDLQWASSESIEMIKRMNTLTSDLPLIILGNYRDDERPDLPETLTEMQPMKLSRLGEYEISELGVSMLGDAGRNQDVIDLLQKETEGNAFFLVEVVRALAEQAGLRENVADMTLPERVFAGGVQEIVQRRLSRVPESARTLLQLAAVGGRQLDVRVLQTLNPDINLDNWLTTCANAAVIDAQGERWRFSHDKFRESLLDDLAEGTPPNLHQQVAEAIETVYPDNPEQAATLAYLWGVAGDEAKELQYRALAGHQDFGNNAFDEAVKHLRRAREILGKLPETPERSKQEFDTQLLIALSLTSSYGFAYPPGSEAWRELYQLSQHFGQSIEQALAVHGLWHIEFNNVNYPQAIHQAAQFLEIATAIDSPLILAEALNAHALNHVMMGDLERGIKYSKRALATYNDDFDEDAVRSIGILVGMLIRDFMQLGLFQMGFLEESRVLLEEARSHARMRNYPMSLTFTLYFDVVRHYFLNDPVAARKWAEEGIEVAQQYNISLFLFWHMGLYGWTTMRAGQIEEGIQQVIEAIRLYDTTGQQNFRPMMNAWLIEGYILAKQWDKAQEQIDATLDHFERIGERFFEAEVNRLYGSMNLQRGDSQAAESRFMKAIQVALSQKAKWWELRATVSLARLWQSQGKIKEAHEKLAKIYDWFTEGFDTADLKDAKALLDELGA